VRVSRLNGSRRSRLLAVLVSLCLVGLAGPAAAASQHLTAGRGDAILAASADVTLVARALPERLTPANRTSLDRNAPAGAALPAAVLVAFLLALRVGRRRVIGTTPRTALLVVAGRGPPVIS
jgi:hypothetical protein